MNLTVYSPLCQEIFFRRKNISKSLPETENTMLSALYVAMHEARGLYHMVLRSHAQVPSAGVMT